MTEGAGESPVYPAKITLCESRPENPKPGDAWYQDEDGHDWNAPEHVGKRPLRVQLTDEDSFMVYGRASREPHAGWTVTGTVEDGTLTVSPSIAISEPGGKERFHGWIRNGEVTTV